MANNPVNTVTGLENPAYKINPRYNEYSYSLAAGDVLDINADSDFVSCLAADYPFKISFDNGPESTFQRGLKYMPGVTIRRVTIRNTASAANLITLGMGIGDIVDARLSVPPEMMAAFRVPDSGFTKLLTIAANTAQVPIAAANINRRELIVSNEGAAKVFVKFQQTNPPTYTGVPLDPGSQIAFEHAGAVYTSNNTATEGIVFVTERGFGLSYIPPTGI